MRGWASRFLIIALVAAIVGFGATVTSAMALAKFTFWIFGALFLISLFIERRVFSLMYESVRAPHAKLATPKPPRE